MSGRRRRGWRKKRRRGITAGLLCECSCGGGPPVAYTHLQDPPPPAPRHPPLRFGAPPAAASICRARGARRRQRRRAQVAAPPHDHGEGGTDEQALEEGEWRRGETHHRVLDLRRIASGAGPTITLPLRPSLLSWPAQLCLRSSRRKDKQGERRRRIGGRRRGRHGIGERKLSVKLGFSFFERREHVPSLSQTNGPTQARAQPSCTQNKQKPVQKKLPHPTAVVKSGMWLGKTNDPDSFAPLRPPG
jgi:hypothetical protein